MEKTSQLLVLAKQARDMEGLECLMRAAVNVPSDTTGWTKTPVHAAVRMHLKLLVELLLDAGHSVNTYCDKRYTPLHLAAKGGSVDIVELLLRYGADVHVEDIDGFTPLHHAVENGSRKATQVLLHHGASVNSRCHHMVTPLLLAVDSGNFELTKLLLEAGAYIEAINEMKQTPLHLAAASGRTDIALQLLKRGANISATDSKGRTALLIACEFQDFEIITLLISVGSDVNAEGQDQISTIDFTLLNRDDDSYQFLKKYCAMLMAANKHVSESNRRHKAPKHWRSRCKVEVDKMKAIKVDKGTLYDIFVSDIDHAASLLRDKALRDRTEKDMIDLVPLYWPYLGNIFRNAKDRLLLLDNAIEALDGLIHSRLPPEVLRKLTKYLRNEDLRCVIVTYQGTDLDNRRQ